MYARIKRALMKNCFDNDLYLKLQSEKILERTKKFGGKLYLEFGGKLFDDLHASRVLPGFDPNIKIKLLEKLKDQLEIIICISSFDIEKHKIRADHGITYDMEVLRLIDNLRGVGLSFNSVVITLYENQNAANVFANTLKNRGIKVYFHTKTKGYPTDVETIVSDEGYGANPYIETTKPLVVVTAPGASSGKLATCLSQIYHENKRGIKAGYAKFETFPVWNLPLKHMVNAAYEAATAEIKDVNMIDPFHFEAYKKVTVNYNRDIEVFPVLREILHTIIGKVDIYKSPTDMGVNMVASAITDEAGVIEASRQEIIRRYYRAVVAQKKGIGTTETAERIRIIINEHNIQRAERKCIKAAIDKEIATGSPSVAIELPDGTIITGRKKELISPFTAVVLNTIKHFAKMGDGINLISPNILNPILNYKHNILHYKKPFLSLRDVLAALAVESRENEFVRSAFETLPMLRGLEAHATYIPDHSDESMFLKLGVNLTCEPNYITSNLFDN